MGGCTNRHADRVIPKAPDKTDVFRASVLSHRPATLLPKSAPLARLSREAN